MRKSKITSALIFLIFAGALIPAWCLPLVRDSTDTRVQKALDQIYEELYFEDYLRTAEALEEQIQIAKRAGRWHMVVSALTLKAQCAYNYYLADKTYEILLEVEALAEEHKIALDSLDPVMVHRSTIHYTRGMHFHELGDFSRAISSFEKIVAFQRELHGIDPQYMYAVHSFIGHSYLQQLMYDRAYLNYERAYAYLRPGKGESVEYGLAMINLLKGQCKEYKFKSSDDRKLLTDALSLYRQALRTLTRWENKVAYRGALTSVYSSLASVCEASGKYDSALYYLNTSLKFHDEKDPVRVLTYDDIGDVYMKLNELSKALPFYERSVSLAEKSYSGKHYMKSVPLFKKAELLLRRNEFPGAIEACHLGLSYLVPGFESSNQFALPPVRLSDESNIDLLLDGLSLKGKIHFAAYRANKNQKELDASVESYGRSIKLIEESQKKFPAAEFKQNLSAKQQSLYEGALEANFASFINNSRGRKQAAVLFQLMEANKSVMLRDAVQETYAQQFLGVPSEVIEQESYLKGSIASGRAKLYQNPGDTATGQWKKELYTLNDAYDSLVGLIRVQYPDYYEAKYGDQMITFEDARASLKPRTALIEYFWGERTLYVLGLTADEFVVKAIDLNSDLNSDVSLLVNTLVHGESTEKTGDPGMFARLSYEVFRKVLQPVLNEWPAGSLNSLVIIPDGILSYLPFDVLLTSEGDAENDYGTLPYLLREYTISNLFLASQLQVKESEKNFQHPYVGFAPSYGIRQRNRTIPSQTTRMTLNPLNFNVREVTDAAAFFDGSVFLGDSATEEKFKAVSNHGRIIHLSMHGFVNDQEPAFSGLAFTDTDTISYASSENDGYLFLHELYNVSLHADLAVLSACETGLGKYARGEGILSLGKAFRYAGCANIVMSLWKVNDKSTADLMKGFFSNLSEGMTKDEALRQTKLAFLSDNRNKFFTHPYYWSAFVLSGDTEPMASLSSDYQPYLAVFTIFLLVMVTLFGVRRYMRRYQR